MNTKKSILALLFIFLSNLAIAENINGKVLDFNKTPVVGAVVAISKGGNDLSILKTDDKGYFHSQDLPNGKYSITANLAGAGSTTLSELDLPGAGQLDEITLILGDKHATVRGRLRAPDRKLPASIQVSAIRIGKTTGEAIMLISKRGNIVYR